MDNYYYRTDINPIISNNSICDGREDEDLADNCIIYFLENNFYDINITNNEKENIRESFGYKKR